MIQDHFAFRHVIDVDGQLAALDEPLVDAATVLSRAGRRPDGPLFLVRADDRIAIGPDDLVRLSEHEVLFFETGALDRFRRACRTEAFASGSGRIGAGMGSRQSGLEHWLPKPTTRRFTYVEIIGKSA